MNMSTTRNFLGPRSLLTLVLLAAAAAIAVLDPLGWLDGPDAEEATDGVVIIDRGTVDAVVSTLESTFEADSGEIVFGDDVTVSDLQDGVVGWIAATESTIGPGGVLYRRNDDPVVLLPGAVPAWRTMTVDDVGVDVAQLEAALLALGYGTESEFTVDDTFTSATAAIVERWQVDLGLAETGSVALGDVVFGPETARVGTVTAAVGDPTSGATLLTLTDTTRHLEFTVPAESIGSITVGTVVSARLPDRSSVGGTVTGIEPSGGGVSTVTASLIVDGETTLPQGDAVPVTVTWTDVVAADAIVLPASALLRLDNGTYAVELITGDGESSVTTVDVGRQVGSQVEILNGVAQGDSVISS